MLRGTDRIRICKIMLSQLWIHRFKISHSQRTKINLKIGSILCLITSHISNLWHNKSFKIGMTLEKKRTSRSQQNTRLKISTIP